MSHPLIGRHKEKEDLERWINSDKSEFIAIYGRRRVGKTFLVKKALGNKITFHFSGSYRLTRKQQLLNFGLELKDQFNDQDLSVPDNWILAFHELRQRLEKVRSKVKVIFLDELPWIDTPRSGLVGALENFWNGWAAHRDDIKLIVCGSATSWIINKIIRNKGGLHNRVNHSMLIKPFQLRECEEYFQAYGFHWSRPLIAECYMTMGGIPYYFSLLNPAESLTQNIDRLFFNSDAPLKNEFEDLYRALYKNYQNHIKIIHALASKGVGLTRQELVEKTKLTNNGEFSNMLEELELCGFIRSYLPFGSHNPHSVKTQRNTLFQLIDFYSLFYLKFHDQRRKDNVNFWSNMVYSPKINAWKGVTFEMLCLCHIAEIKKALGIADVSSDICSWRGGNDEAKVQIDLLIDRMDQTINLCEMKYTAHPFAIDKSYAAKLQEKIDVFRAETHTLKNILLTLISAQGLARNAYSYLIQRLVTLDDLFL